MKIIIAALAALFVAGCATEPDGYWKKSGSTEEQFNADTGSCQAQAFSIGYGAMAPVAIMQQRVLVFQGCMKGKGWSYVSR